MTQVNGCLIVEQSDSHCIVHSPHTQLLMTNDEQTLVHQHYVLKMIVDEGVAISGGVQGPPGVPGAGANLVYLTSLKESVDGASGTWTVPPDVSFLFVIVVGDGGAGARVTGAVQSTGGGGGGGRKDGYLSVYPGQQIDFGFGADQNWFVSAAHAFANHGVNGAGARGGLGGDAGGSLPGMVYRGGDGANGMGTLKVSALGLGINFSSPGGNGGGVPGLSGSARGGDLDEIGVQAGHEPGGGGGGSGNNVTITGNRNGGAGAEGAIIIYGA